MMASSSWRIIYEDGDTETVSEKELASIVLTPELARMEIRFRVAREQTMEILKWHCVPRTKYENAVLCRL
jgi:hypothetical protein